MDILNPNKSLTTIVHPYPVWIIDNFLKPEVPRRINAEWPENADKRWFRGIETIAGKENMLEHGRLAISNYEDMPEFTSNIFRYFHSSEFTSFLGELTGVEGLIPDETFRWSGMRIMLPDSWQLIHSDARKNPLDGKKKELTVLLYLNEGYDRDRDEGCLELWDDDMTHCVESVPPLFNRLVVFRCTDTAYHGVPIVKGERRFLTFSVVSDFEGSERTRALFVRRPNDPDFIAEMGKHRSV